MQQTLSKTEEVIYAMLTENTGSDILDSGGAYGRNWQRNSKKTLEDFKKQQHARLESKYGIVSKSLYWHLVEHLTVNEPLTAYFDKFAELNPDDGYYELMDLWLDSLGVDPEGDFYGSRWAFNSYNFENWLPNQTIQGTFFKLNDEDYLILQVHGGCDVRGGYTKPRVFSLGYEGRDGFIFNAERADFTCTNLECNRRLIVDGYSIEVTDEDGNTLETPKYIEDITACECGGTWNSY
jgi:hypothetical protein